MNVPAWACCREDQQDSGGLAVRSTVVQQAKDTTQPLIPELDLPSLRTGVIQMAVV